MRTPGSPRRHRGLPFVAAGLLFVSCDTSPTGPTAPLFARVWSTAAFAHVGEPVVVCAGAFRDGEYLPSAVDSPARGWTVVDAGAGRLLDAAPDTAERGLDWHIGRGGCMRVLPLRAGSLRVRASIEGTEGVGDVAIYDSIPVLRLERDSVTVARGDEVRFGVALQGWQGGVLDTARIVRGFTLRQRGDSTLASVRSWTLYGSPVEGIARGIAAGVAHLELEPVLWAGAPVTPRATLAVVVTEP